MRLLGKCCQCGNWFVEELGPTTPERVRYLTDAVPLWADIRRCDWCKSMDRRNDTHMFFEEFTGVRAVRAGLQARDCGLDEEN